MAIIDFIIHFDKHLIPIVQHFGNLTYLILFIIIFAETGLVITPFLPGDSLIFALGAFAAQGVFSPFILAGLLILAAILGDGVNYAIGKYLGHRIAHSRRIPFFKKEYLKKAHDFYKKHGGKAIFLARFVPIVRTFAPFVAGMARMDYPKFFIYNVVGGIVWVSIFIFGGFYFGNIPLVKDNFSFVTLVIIAISILPIVIEFSRMKLKNKQQLTPIAVESDVN